MATPDDHSRPPPPPPSAPVSKTDHGIADEQADMTDDFIAEYEATLGDQNYVPPPHLAARFYRNRANAGRKSSAASSRRNSLSSIHSHTSSLSRRHSSTMGCQSNYIAQHLRRNSIIESRKARLADRAAHVEQVRLRAALAKSTPRGNHSNTEEKALAAQLAKEKYLAKVAAACAEEVARAKRIAEETKERRLAEEARVRLEMEERHAEVQRRRAEHQRALNLRRGQRRTDSAETEKKISVLEGIPDVDEEAVIDDLNEPPPKLMSESAAGTLIQRAWRLHSRKKTLQAFTALDLYQRTKSLDFEEMTALVADVQTIAVTTALLMHLGLQDANDELASLNSRTFLSSYMIIGHSAAVLNNKNGAQEQDLIAKASDLVDGFETAISRLAAWNKFSPDATQRETLSQSYSAYTSAFAAWRLQDSSVLIEGMVASFVELDAIWQTVKDDSRGDVASDYREGIRDNQVMLLSRIRKLAGPDRADVLIKKAIRESRRKRPKKRPAAEVRPRGVEPTPTESSTAPQQHAVESSDESAAEAAVVPDVVDEPAAGDNAELTKLFTAMPSNRVLTHELAIDKDYRLEDPHDEVRSQLYRSICESMKRGFETGDGAVWTVSAAENVREKLLRMLKPGNSMHTLISDTMDLDSIYRQCQQRVFSYSGFFQFMSNILPKLCAPFRDAEIKALAEELTGSDDDTGAMIEKLFKLLRMVDALSLDYTNFMIMNAAPTLIREAPGYEQRMFAKDLETGAVSTDKTTRFWRTSFAQLSAEADRRDPEGIRQPEDRPSAERTYAHALVHLTIEQGELSPFATPETLMLDYTRLSRLRASSIRITVIGAILLTAKNLLKRDSRSQWKTQASRLWNLLSDEAYTPGPSTPDSSPEMSPAQKAFSILETAHNMPPSTKAQLQSTIARFFAQAAAATAPSSSHSTSSTRLSDPVLKVLFSRLRAHVLARLSAATASERVRAASGASEALAGIGMPELTGQVAAVVEALERVREVDWAGHGRWYWEIWGQLNWRGEGQGSQEL